MILSEFMSKVNRWPDMHFTAIECEPRDMTHEIYAIDCTHQTMSRLLLCRTPDPQHAEEIVKRFNDWLLKSNRGRNKRRKQSDTHQRHAEKTLRELKALPTELATYHSANI
ncbi:hypothetical protein [Candidatus Pantoea floridensis]|uniref:Uncharacterized protein n=1 Tax=Candidatus Pantoea floridensis TaxID=1938870 RepID=A0A286DNR2_9GAMM|nr:hypothetical protein [Pantoea floridensis]PIF15123.1 hypothetical protein BX596_4231 [Enterobacteriaceae bacterium JKS000233]SOD60335.1 hypothetical protein SAMN06273570_4663 [Pantoea floridensis]